MERRIVILALKDIRHNSRIERQAEALVEAGYDVEVFTILLGDSPEWEQKNGYLIRRVHPEPFHGRLTRRINQGALAANRGIGRSTNALLRGVGKTSRFAAHLLRRGLNSASRLPRSLIAVTRGNNLRTSTVKDAPSRASQHRIQETSEVPSKANTDAMPASQSPTQSGQEDLPSGSTRGLDNPTQNQSFKPSPKSVQRMLSASLRAPVFLLYMLSQALKWLIRTSANGLKLLVRSTARGLCACVRFLTRPFWGIFRTVGFSRQAQRIYAESPAQVYQAHESKAMLAAYRLAKRHHARFICDVVDFSTDRIVRLHGRLRTAISKQTGQISERIFLNRANVVITPTPSLADLIKQYYDIDPTVIMNCTWYKHFKELSPPEELTKKIGSHPSEHILFYTGMITKGHGGQFLCQALARLPAEFMLVLMGPIKGAYEDELQHLIKEFSVQDRVLLLPPVNPRNVSVYASIAHVGLIAHHHGSLNARASLPNKFFEYLMARVPILAPDFPSMRSIIQEHQIGELYEPGDVNSLVHAIQQMIQPERQAMYKKNLESAAVQYSWERQAEKYVQTIRSLHPMQS